MAGYDFSHQYRGLAVIIVNKKFRSKKYNDDRKGGDKDMTMMKDLFKQLGFLVQPHEDLKQQEMVDVLENARQWGNHNVSDCFVCVVSSHGKEEREKKPVTPGAMTWKNSISASDGGDILVEDIVQKFNDKNCPALAGKPKLFFIQACRIRTPSDGKSGYDFGIEIPSPTPPDNNGDTDRNGGSDDDVDGLDKDTATGGSKETDQVEPNVNEGASGGDGVAQGQTGVAGGSESSNEADAARGLEGTLDTIDAGGSGDAGKPLPPVPYDLVPVNCPKDCLIMFPVGTGKFALRNQFYGSYLLQYLYESPHKTDFVKGDMNLLKYLTMVCHRMGKYEFTLVPLMEKYRKDFPHLSEEEIKKKVMYSANLTEEEFSNLPFKMTAHVFHRLKDTIRFTDTPRKVKT